MQTSHRKTPLLSKDCLGRKQIEALWLRLCSSESDSWCLGQTLLPVTPDPWGSTPSPHAQHPHSLTAHTHAPIHRIKKNAFRTHKVGNMFHEYRNLIFKILFAMNTAHFSFSWSRRAIILKAGEGGAGAVARQLRALTAHIEDLHLVHITHVRVPRNTCNSSSRSALFWPLGIPESTHAGSHIYNSL